MLETAAGKGAQEDWHLHVTASPQCVVRLTNTGPERPGGNQFELAALTVRPGKLNGDEGTHLSDA